MFTFMSTAADKAFFSAIGMIIVMIIIAIYSKNRETKAQKKYIKQILDDPNRFKSNTMFWYERDIIKAIEKNELQEEDKVDMLNNFSNLIDAYIKYLRNDGKVTFDVYLSAWKKTVEEK